MIEEVMNLTKHKYIIISIFFLLLFAVFSKSIRGGAMRNIDFAATVKLQDRIDKSTHLRSQEFMGNLMEGSTFFASPGFTIAIVGLLTIIAIVDFKNKKIRLRGLLIPLALGILTLFEIYGKTVVHHPSPPFFMVKNPTTIFPKDYINEQFSYPSGHTARAIFMSVIFFVLYLLHTTYYNENKFNKKIKYGVLFLLICYITLVATSRIYLGHHWLSDIIGGGFLGTSMSVFFLGLL